MPKLPGTTPPVFSAELHPPTTLSPQGFRILMIGSALMLGALSLGFFLAGAWPVVGFFGLDLLALYVAFKVNYRRARACEVVALWPERLTLTRISPKGEESSVEFQPYWLQVLLEDVVGGGCRLSLRSHGRSVEMGSFLGPDEKTEVAERLRRELQRLHC